MEITPAAFMVFPAGRVERYTFSATIPKKSKAITAPRAFRRNIITFFMPTPIYLRFNSCAQLSFDRHMDGLPLTTFALVTLFHGTTRAARFIVWKNHFVKWQRGWDSDSTPMFNPCKLFISYSNQMDKNAEPT
jgi:hypothetical protein